MMTSPTILIYEDHFLSQHLLAASLKSLGFQNVLIANSHADAIERVKAEKEITVLICTVTSADMRELNFLREARECGNIDSLLLISDASPDIHVALAQLARHAGYRLLGILRRPYSKADLHTAIAGYRSKRTLGPSMPLFEMPSADNIGRAACNGEFVPYYQPKLDLCTLEVVGAELLMRWQHPELGLLGPAAFIEVAKHFNHLDTMTFSVLEQALNFIGTQQLGDRFKLSVNIDAAQLKDLSLHKRIRNLLTAQKFRPANLVIEITETGFLEFPEACLENLIHLRMLGCEVSIDDFGTGLSSLQRVCELPCTEIKLDMSFTKALLKNNRSVAAVEHMVKFSNDIGVQLVAEGIETEEQLNMLQKLKCPIGQGYLFSAPVCGEKLMQWMAERKTGRLLKTN
jgi:EAL domain-containing protein (putative c-di-GMP-specific phosphodiesterase class I)